MANIGNIASGESGLSSRTKINEAIIEANKVDSKLDSILLNGGTTGQVLKKNSGTDLDVVWSNESGGGGVTIGTDNQIPFVNATNNDFEYSSGLNFTGTAFQNSVDYNSLISSKMLYSTTIGVEDENNNIRETHNNGLYNVEMYNDGYGWLKILTIQNDYANEGTVIIGHRAAENINLSATVYNTIIGAQSLKNITTGNRNVSLGSRNGLGLIAGNNNVFLGYGAGTVETGSNKLYIDSSVNPRSDEKTDSLIYGEFNATPSLQLLRINGRLDLLPISSDPTGAIQGTIYYNSTSNIIKYYNGSSWLTLATI
jgi:hypothetical protein